MNIPIVSVLKEMLGNNYSVKHLMSKSFSNEPAFDEAKPNSVENTLGTSLRHQVPKIFPTLSTLYILERVAGKILFSQFSETTALCCKNIGIMPALGVVLHI